MENLSKAITRGGKRVQPCNYRLSSRPARKNVLSKFELDPRIIFSVDFSRFQSISLSYQVDKHERRYPRPYLPKHDLEQSFSSDWA